MPYDRTRQAPMIAKHPLVRAISSSVLETCRLSESFTAGRPSTSLTCRRVRGREIGASACGTQPEKSLVRLVPHPIEICAAAKCAPRLQSNRSSWRGENDEFSPLDLGPFASPGINPPRLRWAAWSLGAPRSIRLSNRRRGENSCSDVSGNRTRRLPS